MTSKLTRERMKEIKEFVSPMSRPAPADLPLNIFHVLFLVELALF